MSAQTNDPLNTLTPVSNDTTTQSTPPVSPFTPQTPTDNSVTPTLPVEENVLPVETEQVPQTTVEENDVKPKTEEDEKESPLQALAKKLSKLREELIQEVPETEDKNSSDVKPEDTTVPVDSNTLMEDKLTNTTELPELPTEPDPLSTPDVENVADTFPQTVMPVEEPPQLETTDTQTVSEFPVQPPVDPLNNLSTSQVPEVALPDVPVQTDEVPVDPMDMLTAQAPMASQVTEPKPEISLDENDNSMVEPEKVEVASVGSKYPLSINKIMEMAIERNASDIQVSVGYPVMIRIDGTLIEANPQIVSSTNAEELIMPVLSEQKKELLEVNREVDLAYSPMQNAGARFRINAYYAKGNLTAAFRLIPARIRTIEELMLPPIYNQLVKLSQGLVLVTGPTGHGKSTTLAAMLQAVNSTRAVHMLTIEDPIEYMFEPSKAVVDQREMHDDTHSWTVALKSALRQDPDVILVGEMRDYETIASTITLAETGHLVFATLHTNSAAQTVDRIIDVFPENQQAQIRTQLANILEAVIAQRLIPIDGGGRRAVSEIMLGTPAVRNLIREGKTHQLDNVIRTSADVGMFSLEQSLVKLVRDGLITMERAQEYAVHPEEVVRLLKT